MTDISNALSELIAYANTHLFLRNEDNIYVFNRLAAQFGESLAPPSSFSSLAPPIESVLDQLNAYALKKKLIKKGGERDFECQLLSNLVPLPSFFTEYFDALASESGFRQACEFLYNYAIKSNYIDKRMLQNNVNWSFKAKKGSLVLSINAAKNTGSVTTLEPSESDCPICNQNLGKRGAYSLLRNVSLPLGMGQWLLQYSPFSYFNEHFNLISALHEPMHTDERTYMDLIEFLDYAPFYFIGSNCELKNVGASNPSHKHYQGGKTELPVFSANSRLRLSSAEYPRVRIKVLDWYTDTIRLESMDTKQLLALSSHIAACWRGYSSKSIGLVGEKGGKVLSGVSSLAFKNKEDEYVIDLTLRNSSEEFAPSKSFACIKPTPLGLIEAAGIFILPSRLYDDLSQIREKLVNGVSLKDFGGEDNPLSIYLPMVAQLANDLALNKDADLDEMIQNYINTACERMLAASAVFGQTEQGEKELNKFLKAAKLLNIEY